MKKLEELGISPWPWGAYYTNRGFSDVHAADGTLVSCVENPPTEMQMADTKMIAAAPDMYKVLFDILAIENSGDWDNAERVHEVFNAAKAALAKASGEEVAK